MITSENLSTHKTLFTIQALRAIAASAVVVLHTLSMMVHNAGYSFPIPGYGAIGVDLFFVISGFIMVYTNHGTFFKPNAPLSFMRRRVIRIVPIYWLYTTVLVLLLGLQPGLFTKLEFEWPHVISSYLFLLSKNNVGIVGTVLQTGWSLCYEMYFYLVFAILLWFPQKFFLLIAGVIFAAGIAMGSIVGPLPVWLTVTTNQFLLEFYLGAVIAFVFLNGYFLSRPLALAAIACAIAAVHLTEGVDLGQWTRVIFWGLPSGVMVIGAVSLERAGLKTPRLLVALGNSSYSLYLVHTFILPALGKGWTVLHLSNILSPALLFIMGFCVSIVAGHVSYLALEKPITQWLLRRWR